jgi:hypothetical protein
MNHLFYIRGLNHHGDHVEIVLQGADFEDLSFKMVKLRRRVTAARRIR